MGRDRDMACSLSPEVRKVGVLPLFGQALVACRLARRAVLAMLEGEVRAGALLACDEIEGIVRTGCGWRDRYPGVAITAGVCRADRTRAALESVRWANDSAGAAEGANDFPVDGIVTASAVRCIEAVRGDPRVSALQVMIVVESDVDSIAFACKESGVHTYDALGAGVLQRLAPCHPLTLTESTRSTEDHHR